MGGVGRVALWEFLEWGKGGVGSQPYQRLDGEWERKQTTRFGFSHLIPVKHLASGLVYIPGCLPRRTLVLTGQRSRVV